MTCTPKTVPTPNSSRMEEIRVMASVKPRPMPKPSTAEASGLFLKANASARPKMMQLTTISGMNTPRDASSAGRNALMIS